MVMKTPQDFKTLVNNWCSSHLSLLSMLSTYFLSMLSMLSTYFLLSFYCLSGGVRSLYRKCWHHQGCHQNIKWHHRSLSFTILSSIKNTQSCAMTAMTSSLIQTWQKWHSNYDSVDNLNYYLVINPYQTFDIINQSKYGLNR